MKKTLVIGILLMALLTTAACNKATTTDETKPATGEETTSATNTETKKEDTAEKKEQDDFVHPEVTKTTIDINGHTYDYDIVASATKEIRDENPPEPMKYEEKIAKMFWSGKPVEGYVHGDYYHIEKEFEEHESQTNPGKMTAYTAIIDVVKDGDKLVMVEMDEIGPDDYYAKDWAGITKRNSGYAFFQAQNQRTEKTMVTWVNGQTYLEAQMLGENRLDGDFNTTKGSSNSGRKAFIPAAAELAKIIETTPSNQQYYALTKNFDGGLTARLALIYEGDKIVDVKYDEYFADTQDEITNETDKQFYRQSKYYSLTYKDVTGKDFVSFEDAITTQLLELQLLSSVENKFEPDTFTEEYEHFQTVATELETLIAETKSK